ncbi:hypothetical protein Clopa_2848 [Clostridium pasteurianum BC1]|uniref:Uncharacterized protein n=2 Tax=Clostridium pasteurianum TaxID=1501 RepID=R4K7J3_CLOPA|nr:hypothetical protein Clopa_2848 [Clostridium pasteurianum BC1]
MIYTLIIGLIIILITSYVFMLEARKKAYILDLKKNITEKPYSRETNEYLFLEMNNYILSSTSSVNKTELYKLFSAKADKNKVGNDDYFIYYDIPTDKFIIRQDYRQKQIKKDIYDYNFIDGKIKYIYTYSRYD